MNRDEGLAALQRVEEIDGDTGAGKKGIARFSDSLP